MYIRTVPGCWCGEIKLTKLCMKPFLAIYGLRLLVLFNLFFGTRVYSQQVLFSDSLGSFDNNSFCTIAGRINAQYIAIECNPFSNPQYFVLDTSCRLLKQETLSFIPPGGFIKAAVIPERNEWVVLWQSIQNNKWYLHHTWISGTSNEVSRSTAIDSAPINAGFRLRPYFINESPDHRYQALFKRIPDFENDQLLVDLIIINTSTGRTRRAQMVLPFNKEFDVTSDVMIDDRGNVFTTVFDNPSNFRLSSSIHVYQFSETRGQIAYPVIVSKEKKPTVILLQQGASGNQLILASLYYDFFSKNVNGLTGTIINETTLHADSLFYFDFSKELKKQINKYISGVSNDKAMNFLELKACRFNAMNGITLLLELYHQSYTPFNNYSINDRSSLLNQNNLSNTVGNFSPLPQAAGLSRGGGRRGRNLVGPQEPATANMPQRSLTGYDNSLPGQSLRPGYNTASPGALSIPIQHVSVMAAFDNQFHLTGKQIIQNRITSEMDFIAPYTSLKSGLLEQFVYDYRTNKNRIKQISASLAGDSLWESQNPVNSRYLLLLNHPGIYKEAAFLLTFYHNREANTYGLAKLSW